MDQHKPVTVRVRRLDERASLPSYHSELAAGMDLVACLPRGVLHEDAVVVWPGRIEKIPTGIAVAIPPGFEGQVRPRSGLASRHGVTLPNSPGTIDADYRGELFVPLINLGHEAFEVTHGTRIAQLVIAPVVRATLQEVESLDETVRGVGGFGSTGAR